MTLAYATFFSNLVVTLIAILVELELWNPFTLKKEMKIVKLKEKILNYGIPLAFTTLISILFQMTDKANYRIFFWKSRSWNLWFSRFCHSIN